MFKVVPISIVLGLCLGLSAQAQVPLALNLSGALYTSSGATVSSSNVSFKIEIWDKNLTCVLYSEQHLGLDLSTSKGAFAFPVGSGSSQANNLEGGTGFDAKLFQNYGATGTFNGCVGGVTSAANDNRLIRVYYDTAGGSSFTPLSPDISVTSAPYAMIAETLQGKTPANFILTNVNSFLGQSSVENIFSNVNYPVLTSLLAGNSNLYISSSPTGPVSFHNQLLTNIANPTAAQDAATKSYVDGSVGGQTFDPTGVGLGVGNGKTIIWDAGLNKWVAANVGGVSSVGTGTGLIGGPITSSGTISVDVGTAANKIVQLNGSAQLPSVDGSLLTNINSSRIGGQPVSAVTPLAGQILTYNNSQWTAVTNNAITALSGDVVATGPGAVTSAIQPNAITSAKINNSGNAVNRLLITNASDGSTVTYATCTLVGEVMQWTALGWACADPATFLGTTGVVADTYGNGTQVPQVTVDATGRVQSLTNVNIAFPVVSVAGHTGVVTLNATDIGGLGTAALQNVGVVASDVLQLNGSAQIPAVDGSLLTNINATKLGTRSVSSAAPSPGQVLSWNNTNSDWEPSNASAGSVISVQAGVGMTGGPITSSGSLNVDVGVTANKIVQMNGSAQLPAVDGSLLTNINTAKLGTRAVSSAAPSPGQVLGWNSTNNDWEPSPSSAGSVTSVQAGVGMTGGPITSAGSLNVDVGVTANKIVQLNGSAQLPAVDGSQLTNVNVSNLIGKSVSSVGPSAGQVLTYNNTTGKWDAESSQAVLPSLASAEIWVGNGLGAAGAVAPAGDVAMDNGGNFTVKALQGKAVSSGLPSGGQVLTYNGTTSQWEAETTQASVSGWVNGGNTFGGNSSLGNKDGYALSFLTNNSARMVIDNAGNVGIGTATPAHILTVDGGIQVGAADYDVAHFGATTSGGTMISIDNKGTNNKQSILAFESQGSIMWYLNSDTNASGAQNFAIYDYIVAKNRLLIDNIGNVGIGTSAPVTILDVYGTGTNSAMLVPRDTTLNRPTVNAANGMLRYNTSLAALESYINGSWQTLATSGGSNNFATDATFTGAGTGLAVTNTATVGGSLTVGGAAVLNGGATVAGGALNMSSQSITNVGASVAGAGALSIAAGGTNKNLVLSGSGTGNVLLAPNVGIGTTSATSEFQVGNVFGVTSAGYVTANSFTNNGTYYQANSNNTPYASTGSISSLAGNASSFWNQQSLDSTFSGSQWLVTNTATNTQTFYIAGVSNSGAANYTPSIVFGQQTGSNSYAERMRIDQNGNVGIGTASPMAMLDAVNPQNSTTAIAVENTNAGASALAEFGALSNAGNFVMGIHSTAFAYDSGAAFVWNSANTDLFFGTNNSERMRINANGNVGIGTVSPNAMLEVDPTLTSTSGTDYGVRILPTVNASGTEGYTALLVNTTESAIGSGTKLLFDLQVGGSSKFNVTDAGNLALSGSSGGGAGNISLTNSSGGQSSSSVLFYGGASVQKAAVASAWMNAGTDSNLTFYTRGSSVTAEKVRIDNKGNVGIGTTTPQALLDVFGTGSFSAIVLPRDTTANRPQANTTNGMLRYNTDIGALESYLAGSWQTLATSGGANNFSTDATFNGSGTGLAVTNTAAVGGNLTVTGGSTLNGGLTVAGGALNMSSQNITNVGSAITGSGTLSIAAGGSNKNLVLSGSGTGYVLLTPNVGIGTVSPGFSLDVVGTIGATTLSGRTTTQNANDSIKLAPGSNGNLFIDNVGTATAATTIMGWDTPQFTGANNVFQIYNNSTNHTLLFQAQSKGSSTGTDNISFPNSGVTIGNGLFVTGSSNAVIDIKDTGSATFNWALESMDPNLTSGQAVINYIGVDSTADDGGYMGFHYNGLNSPTNFLTFGLNSANDLMVLTGNGSVGIGTTSPSATLTVNGPIVSLQSTGSVTGSTPSWASTLNFATTNAFSVSPSSAVANDTLTLTFSGTPANGANYLVSVKDPVVLNVVFSAASCGTIKYKPGSTATNTITTSGTSGTLITLTTIYNGTNYDCYVTWATGYQ